MNKWVIVNFHLGHMGNVCLMVDTINLPPTLGDMAEFFNSLLGYMLDSKCKNMPLDLVFIIDSSRSVRPTDYEKVKEFVINILSFLDVGLDATRVGLIQYGSTVQHEFSLKTYMKKADIHRAVRGMTHMASGTMTGLALQYIRNVAFTEAEGARPLDMHVPRVAMIVTDGRPQDTVEEIAAKTRNSGIIIFAIGVGRVDMKTLKAIGSEPHEDHVSLVANFSQIETLISVFQTKFCGAQLCSVLDHGCTHTCINTPGSYVCRCRRGYSLNPDKRTCSTEDLCAVMNHGCEHICRNVPGSYLCACHLEFQLNEDGKTCRRIDYCALGTHGCEHECVSTENSYICRCQSGYSLNPDKRTCKKIDYCALGGHGCEHECVNTEDSYMCRCRRGFTLNVDRKTCKKTDYCASGVHSCEQECVNTEDSYICRCRRGFTLNTDQKTCRKIDYCALGGHGCEHECINTEDSYMCRCQRGFTLNVDRKTCKKIDYCALGNHGCEHECVNTENFHVCRCDKGYTLNPDGKTCRSLDICSTVRHGCEHVCVNTGETYICKCNEGYILGDDGKRCKRCGEGMLDLVFVIDGSKSLGPHNFEVVKQFVKGLVSSLEISQMATQVGLVQYSTKVQAEFTLGNYSSGKDVSEAVSKVKYMGKGSMTGKALKYMVEKSFSEEEGARPQSSNASKVAVVFTDGRAQDDVSRWATKAKQNGITIYAVGVGKAIEEELKEIASEPQAKHLYYAEDFSTMDEIAEKLKTRICQEKPSTEDQCKCENIVAFQTSVNAALKILSQKYILL
ncbi:matrilin-2 [Protopterus annectens]|uniref:matrilin-2 n=1 Tax=Protopterus annectens TaxID=7888 RepID=UPI001CFB110E|nr:matrilin-2 [Protopterus annectens]